MNGKKYKEILRFYNNGFSQRQIAQLSEISRGTVVKVIDAFKSLNVTWEEVKNLDEIELEKLLFDKSNKESMYLVPDFEMIAKDLYKKGVNVNF